MNGAGVYEHSSTIIERSGICMTQRKRAALSWDVSRSKCGLGSIGAVHICLHNWVQGSTYSATFHDLSRSYLTISLRRRKSAELLFAGHIEGMHFERLTSPLLPPMYPGWGVFWAAAFRAWLQSAAKKIMSFIIRIIIIIVLIFLYMLCYKND